MAGARVSRSDFPYRPALDGVRCVAVIAVLVYHLDPRWLPGGFLGVDVFFALSGYLITTLLILERERHGRISVTSFWSRRARRLLPAALVVIAAVSVWLHSQQEFIRAARRGDLLATLADVANWRLIASGQSYFETFATASPLRHFWSLAIEEQFYLVWPIACVLLLRSNRLRTLTTACIGGIFLSAVWCGVVFDASNPSRAYYGTDTRVHQLLIGALLAAGLAHRRRIGRPIHVSDRVVVGGVILLVAAMFTVHDQWSGYYRGGSVAVALVTVSIIAGIEAAPCGLVARLVGNPSAAAVGRVSYGLYLWHWPIYVWMSLGTWGLAAGWQISIARLAVTAAVTVASYRYIERPIRDPRTRVLQSLKRPVPVVAGSFSAIGLVVVLTLTMTWGAQLPPWAGGAQLDRFAGRVSPTSLRVVIVGDSVASSFAPALADVANNIDWELFNASEPGCPITGLTQVDADDAILPQAADCASIVPDLHRQVVEFAPDVVLWHDLQSTMALKTADGRTVAAGSDEWARRTLEAWQRELDEYWRAGSEVVVILPPLRSQDTPTGGCGPSQRCQDIQAQDQRIRTLTLELLERNAGRVHRLELDARLCPNGYPCPVEIDGIEVRLKGWDQTHFTKVGARWIAPTLIKAVEAAAGSHASRRTTDSGHLQETGRKVRTQGR